MSVLFEKTRIGTMKLKNRIVMGPMSTTGESDGAYSMEAIHYFTERAKGGCGLIITGANLVTTEYEPRTSTELSNYHHAERLNMLVERCHHYGAKVCVQLSPGLGRLQFIDPLTSPYSAGESSVFWFPSLTCKSIPAWDIGNLVWKVGYAASLARMAGADAIELLASGGYLLDQFQTPVWNTRTDEYGGGLRNRMRFTLECIESIRESVGPGFPILVKFAPCHGFEGGRSLEEGLEIARLLEEAEINAIHVDVGCHETWYRSVSTVYQKDGHQLETIQAVKDTVNIPVFGQGKLFDPAVAEDAVASGKLDYVVLAHQMLADPYWAVKVKEGRQDEIAPCIGCNECLLSGFSGKHLRCAVNPLCYTEREYALPGPDPAGRGTDGSGQAVSGSTEQLGSNRAVKSVLVIGGGPGGMSAAIAAAKRGYRVDLWEKSDRLGGNLWAAGLPTFKKDVFRLIAYMQHQIDSLNISVFLSKEARAGEVIAGNYDKVILAAGSKPVIPRIPGTEYASPAADYLLGHKKPGTRIVVIGGGMVGCETAAYMKEMAEEVTIVEMLGDILAIADHCLNNDQALRSMLKERGIRIVAGVRVTDIIPDCVICEKGGETIALSCDTVILAAGYRASNELEQALDGKVKDLCVIGDAEAPRKIMNAIHEGYHAIRIME